MKRYGNLWDRMISFERLLLWAHAAPVANASSPALPASSSISNASCSCCTRNLPARPTVPVPTGTFTIYQGKTRHISAAPFRDRVVHHALTGVLEPIFDSDSRPFRPNDSLFDNA